MKKSYLIIFFLLSCIIVLSGCVESENDIEPDCRSGCGTIRGYITTGDGTEPLPNVNLAAYWKYTPKMYGGTVRRKAIGTTDDKGYYELNFQVKNEELEDGYFEVELTVDTTEYLTHKKEGHHFGLPYDMRRDTVFRVDYFIPKLAFVEIVLKNQTQIQESDFFAIEYYFQNIGVNGEQGRGMIITWESESSSNRVLEVPAIIPVVVNTHKTKDGVKTTTNDTLNLEVGDKVIYEVEF